VIKMREEATESALCVGTIAALAWGIGLSLYGFHSNSGDISWAHWGAQLFGGVLACLAVPILWVRGAFWVTSKLGEARARGEVRQG
jgi:hypothetical protein